MYISLKTKIWVFVNLCVLSVTLFTYFYFPSRQYRYHVDVYTKELDYVAKTIATSVNVALSDGNFQGIKTAMEYAQSDSRLKFVAMVQTAWEPGADKPVRQLFRVFPENIRIDVDVASSEDVIVQRAEFTSDIMNGEIIIGFSTAEILLNVMNLKQSILMTGIFILFVSSFLSYVVSRNITMPLEKLRQASHEVSAGNLDLDMHLNRKDELGDLVKAFDNMIKELNKSRTRIKLQKAELEKTNEELKLINEEKNSLIGIVSHDLRSPLNQIKGLLSLLRLQNLAVQNEGMDLLEQSEKCVDRLNEMIIKILDVGSSEGPGFKLTMDKTSVREVLNEAKGTYRQSAEKKEISIVEEAYTRDYYLYVDRQYTILIFENLLSNAIKFSPRKSTVKIEVSDSNSDPFVTIKVHDNGSGITKEDQSKLFHKYQRLGTRPTEGESSIGLGLSIVKKYVERMGGQVYYEDRSPGSTFIVRLPKYKAEERKTAGGKE